MSEKDLRIRVAVPEDLEQLLAIYIPYVKDTVITFEYEPPSSGEFRGRIENILERYPYLAAEADGEIWGYAYAGAFKGRPAYAWAVETTIYVRRDQKQRGVGRLLYNALEKALALQNITNLNACIAYSETEDEYLTKDSVRFHEKMGYRLVGQFYKCGYKFNRWYDMVWMEKHIGPHLEHQPEVKPFSQVREQLKAIYGIK